MNSNLKFPEVYTQANKAVTITVQYMILANGTVDEASMHCYNSADMPPAIFKEAKRVLLKTKDNWQPAKVNDVPVACWALQSFRFVMP